MAEKQFDIRPVKPNRFEPQAEAPKSPAEEIIPEKDAETAKEEKQAEISPQPPETASEEPAGGEDETKDSKDDGELLPQKKRSKERGRPKRKGESGVKVRYTLIISEELSGVLDKVVGAKGAISIKHTRNSYIEEAIKAAVEKDLKDPLIRKIIEVAEGS